MQCCHEFSIALIFVTYCLFVFCLFLRFLHSEQKNREQSTMRAGVLIQRPLVQQSAE